MDDLGRVDKSEDPFLVRYQQSELKIASEFLSAWLPFLSRDLCSHCVRKLSDRIGSLGTNGKDSADVTNSNHNASSSSTPNNCVTIGNTSTYDNCDANSVGSGKDGAEADTHSLGSWKDEADGVCETRLEASRIAIVSEPPRAESAGPRMSWADMAQQDELEGEEEEDEDEDDDERETKSRVVDMSPSTGDLRITKPVEKPQLSRDEREYIRFMHVKRKKDFICFERVKGKLINVVEGLELHTSVFSSAEQKRIVDFVYELQEKGRKGELRECTYTAPKKWMRGKGRVTLQFGCCYNYATDKNNNPPGILKHETADPLPDLFKVMIKRLVKWHVLPPTCVPDSCIVNIYNEGDCIPPHIDHHDFVRPFCTVSFLSECNILFSTNLEPAGPGEFIGQFYIPLPVGSVLVLNGNGADVAKHCVPAVPTKRISITFRKMDASKKPIGFTPEPDLQGIEPLPYVSNETMSPILHTPGPSSSKWPTRREGSFGGREFNVGSGGRYSSQGRRRPSYRRRN